MRKRPRRWTTPLGVLAATLLLANAGTAQQIDTRVGGYTGSWVAVGEEDISAANSSDPILEGRRRTYNEGQTFLVADPTQTQLDQFSFWLAGAGTGGHSADVLFRAYIMGWDPATERPTSILWRSGDTHGTTGSLEEFAFITGGLTLDPDNIYLAMLSSAVTPGLSHPGDRTYNNTQTISYSDYGDGYRVHGSSYYLEQSRTQESVLLDDHFASVDGDYQITYYRANSDDLAFTATFSAAPGLPATSTPEPVSMALLGTGLVGIGVVRRRRGKQLLQG